MWGGALDSFNINSIAHYYYTDICPLSNKCKPMQHEESITRKRDEIRKQDNKHRDIRRNGVKVKRKEQLQQNVDRKLLENALSSNAGKCGFSLGLGLGLG